MYLKEAHKLWEIWNYALNQDANVVLMRHAPKAGSNLSDLSEEGKRLAERYGRMLISLDAEGFFKKAIFVHTEKSRTTATLQAVFPFSDPAVYLQPSDLVSPAVSPFVQNQVDRLHVQLGHRRGYYLNHTYYFLENLGGGFDAENLHTVVAERMSKGIRELFEYDQLVIYCGHSPSIEVGCEHLLGISLQELGGFLNPLDSIHLRKTGEKIDFVARINPVIGYVDLESENYYKDQS